MHARRQAKERTHDGLNAMTIAPLAKGKGDDKDALQMTKERTYDGHNAMTIAHWPKASGAKNYL